MKPELGVQLLPAMDMLASDAGLQKREDLSAEDAKMMKAQLASFDTYVIPSLVRLGEEWVSRPRLNIQQELGHLANILEDMQNNSKEGTEATSQRTPNFMFFDSKYYNQGNIRNNIKDIFPPSEAREKEIFINDFITAANIFLAGYEGETDGSLKTDIRRFCRNWPEYYQLMNQILDNIMRRAAPHDRHASKPDLKLVESE